jgi:hypothetical protein
VLERPGRAWLATLELPAVSREVAGDDLALIGALQGQIGRLDGEIHQRARPRPAGEGAHPAAGGVGPFTALVILAEIGDVSRFASARQLASWAGLTPTVRGSDRIAHYGHISKQGSAWLRWVRCEAAQTAKRSPQFAATYQGIATRRGKKIATTAIARKLLTRAWHLLTDSETTTLPPAAAAAAPRRRCGDRPGGVTRPRASSQISLSRPRRARRSDRAARVPGWHGHGPRPPAGGRMGGCETPLRQPTHPTRENHPSEPPAPATHNGRLLAPDHRPPLAGIKLVRPRPRPNGRSRCGR